MTAGPTVPRDIMVLDTNVISELMSVTPDVQVQAWVREVPPATTYTTAVTLAEVRFGIAHLPAGRRRTFLVDAADDIFDAFADRVLPFDAAAANVYGNIVVEREQIGTPISGFDAQIAAICRSRRATLATRNTNDFSHLGLDLIDPWLIDASG